MKFAFIRAWLKRLWGGQGITPQDFLLTFSSPHGARVLNHLVDNVYCKVYEGKEVSEMWMHEGRRSLVQEMLENIQIARDPKKYGFNIEAEEVRDGVA